MAARHPEERVTRPVVCQRWQSLTFLHWTYEPGQVQRLLPDGLEVDTFAGAAWVGLTPFLLVDLRLACLPTIPRLLTYPETNVRTYVRDRQGVDGLWFFSLDVGSLANVVGARALYRVPYHWSAMRVEDGPVVRYRSRRRTGAERPGHDIVVRPGAPLEETHGLVDFLTGRWRAFTRLAGRFASVPVEHEPWPLCHAEVEALEEDLVAAAGLPAPEGPPLAHFSPGVNARLGAPRL